MKKISVLWMLVAFFLVAAYSCKTVKADGQTYKARLEIKGICGNYTLKMLDDVDTSLVVPEWRDEHTGKTYTNVFGLATICNFPADINEGDVFTFVIDTNASKDCAVCMAYYPTPEKKLLIRVISREK